ncbi:MAG: sulfotransferase [Planctomycetota bacterium]
MTVAPASTADAAPAVVLPKPDDPRLRKPIILIGTERSGTTWLGCAFREHPDLAIMWEPRHIWSHGHYLKPHERLTADDATPSGIRWIREQFLKQVIAQGRQRISEKTPINTLRVPYVHAAFPDAKFLFLVRDGRSVVRSTAEIAASGVRKGSIIKRMKHVPLLDWPFYVPRYVDAMRQKFLGGELGHFGARPPGWKQWVAEGDRDVTTAKVWSTSVNTARADLANIDHLFFRYEDLVRDPATTRKQIYDFCELAPSAEMDAVLDTAKPDRVDAWRNELDDDTLARIKPHLIGTLNSFGYEW